MKKVLLWLVLAVAIIFGIFINIAIHTIFVKQKSLEDRIGGLEKQTKLCESSLKEIRGMLGPPPEDFSKVYEINPEHSFIFGDNSAPVTITEFTDMQCPFCARFHAVISEVVKNYPGKVRSVVKNFPLPFHQFAIPAAKAVFAAGVQGKYGEMMGEVLENHNSLSEDKFKELAKKVGLNVSQFLKDYKEKDALWQEYIQKDIMLGEKSEVRGTPTFYINGRKTRARDLESFKREIDQVLK